MSANKMGKVKREYKKLTLELLLKMSKKLSLKYTLVRNASSLVPINVIRQPEQNRIRFRALADQLYSLKLSVADISKNHYEQLCKMAKYEHKEEFTRKIN